MGTRKNSKEDRRMTSECKIKCTSRMLKDGRIMTTTVIAPNVTDEELELFKNSFQTIGDSRVFDMFFTE